MISAKADFRKVIECSVASYKTAMVAVENVLQTYRLVTATVQIIRAIGEYLKIGRKEFIRNSGINVDEELLESRYDSSSSVVVQAAIAREMAILAVPVVTAAVGKSTRWDKRKEK